LKSGEFTFLLLSGDEVVSTASNTAAKDGESGVFVLSVPTITKAGEYTYTVVEKLEKADNGVAYDYSLYTVVLKVVDQNAKLVVENVSIFKDQNTVSAIEFNNTYVPKSTEVTLGATKVLEGRDLINGEFTFELKNAAGEVIDTATNDVDGLVTFDSLTYEKAGVYTYTISEVIDSLEYVTYDTSVHTIVVTVTDNQEGYLTAAVDESKEVVFTNVYKEPEPTPTPTPTPTPDPTPTPKPDGPGVNTGDSSNIFGFMAMAMTALAAIYVTLFVRRRTTK